MTMTDARTAADGCEHWCIVKGREHEDNRDDHVSRMEKVVLWGSSGWEADLFLHLSRPYVEGLPLTEVQDRRVDITLAVDDDEPCLRLTPPVARSVAAALLRLADLEEATPRG